LRTSCAQNELGEANCLARLSHSKQLQNSIRPMMSALFCSLTTAHTISIQTITDGQWWRQDFETGGA